MIGTCLSLDDLARIARKTGYAEAPVDELDLHVQTVSVAGSRNAASRALQKWLERKHARYVRDFEKARDDAAVERLWREHFDGGLVAGPLWAVMTHRAAGAETRSRAYRDVPAAQPEELPSRRVLANLEHIERVEGQVADASGEGLPQLLEQVEGCRTEKQIESLAFALAPGPVDKASKGWEESGRPVDLVQDHQVSKMVGQVELCFGKPSPVPLRFEIELQRLALVTYRQGQRGLARLARPEQHDRRHLGETL